MKHGLSRKCRNPDTRDMLAEKAAGLYTSVIVILACEPTL